ncbi:MAG: glycosyltransferase family 2 protein [Alphaproteobacteria bacterium]|nr:glycosyltransferase family 2 protein [Alphaproteobacteria bacterium]
MPLRIAIIIPAYNEEKTIERVLSGVSHYDYVIVADDGSRDKTAAIAEKAGAIVIRHEVNQGYDGALRSGLLKAIEMKADIAVTIDADGQHNPDNIAKILTQMQETGADCVIGVRPERARISEKIFCAYTKLRFGISDILCGLKAYRLNTLQKYTSALDLKSAGTAAALSIAKGGHTISETAIEVRPREDEARIGNAWKANFYILGAMIRTL